jgi:acetoin utilization protein AcuB
MTNTLLLTGNWSYTAAYHPATLVPDPDQIGTWMTSPVRVIAPGTSVRAAQAMMMGWNIRRLPVVEDGRLVGIVTQGDLRESRPLHSDSLNPFAWRAERAVSSVMTSDPITVTPTTTVSAAARLMVDQKIGGLPVLDAAGTLVGIITESDLIRLLIR